VFETAAPARVLAGFVPAAVLRRYGATDALPPEAEAEPIAGAVLFADISGFTPLAERLGVRGGRGAEELTAILNLVFGHLITSIDRHGGEVLKFAGDALLAVWEDPDTAAAALRAAACGLELHGVAEAAAGETGVELTLRIGIGAGPLELLYVVGDGDRRECLATGSPLDQMTVAEHQARVGDTVLSAQAWAGVASRAAGLPLGEGCVRLLAVREPAAPSRPRSSAERSRAEALAPFVSRAVRERVAAGQSDWLSELRRVTVLFLCLQVGEGETLATTQAAFERITEVFHRYQATVDKLSVDDKGLIALVALGLPPLSHPDDPERGVMAALELQAALAAQGQGCRIGIATGRVFCGVVGSALRREYTVIGDTVNLAARLMQQAGEGILCDEATHDAAQVSVRFAGPQILNLKGKSEPIRAFVAVGLLDQRPPVLEPLVRRAELDALTALLDGLAQDQGGVVVIEGGSGQGKSQLLASFLTVARARGARIFSGAGDPIEQASPYFAWRPVVEALLGLDGLGSRQPSARRGHIERAMAADVVLARLGPLLRDLVEVDLPDSELTAAMQGEVRAFNTQDLLVHLLRQAVGAEGAVSRPALLVLEDAQWLDSASWALLRQVVEGVAPFLVVVASRPLVPPLPPALAEILQRPEARTLRLEALTREETTALLRERLGGVPSGGLVEAIHERAGGNPFFTRELALAMAERGLIVEEEGLLSLAPRSVEADVLALPDTVQAVVLARIDRLEPRQQLMLKVASVIGRSFSYDVLHRVYPVADDRPVLRQKCNELVGLELTRLEQPEPAPSWLHQQETTREVAYDLLLFAQRRQLHQTVAETLEGEGSDSRSARLAPRLAWHWGQAGRRDKEIVYLEQAGDLAIREGAYLEAEAGFRRLQDLLQREPELVPAAQRTARRAHWERQRGEALLGLGRLRESRAALEGALGLLGYPVPASLPGVGWSLLKGAARQVGFRKLGRRPRPLSAEDRRRRTDAAQACLRLIETYFFLASPAETLNAALQALNIAEETGPSPELARAYALTGWILSMIPLFGMADHYLALAAELISRPEGQAARQPVLFFTGFTRSATGAWEESRRALEEAIELARELGDKRRWIEAVCGISSPLHFQGEYERRVELGREVLYTSARRQGDLQAEAWGILDQMESLLALGDLRRLEPLLDELEPFLKQDVGRSEQVWGHGMLAHGRLLQGRLQPAWEAARAANRAAAGMAPVAVYVFEGHAGAIEALLGLREARWEGAAPSELEAELEQGLRQLRRYARVFPYARARLLSCRGRAQLGTGRTARALSTLRRAVQAAVEIRMPLEEGIARLALALATGDPAELERARALFAGLNAAIWLARAAS
jgi:class 3 adenylate cyclase/tetratricopeptide (TPR) repeat protein